MTRILLLLFLVSKGVITFAQETVTIPRSRLEELERKEAELEKLKAAVKPQPALENPATGNHDEGTPNRQPQTVSIAAPPSEKPAVVPLTPLEKDTVVSAMDLAAHYRANAALADERYRRRTFKVQGEIVGFDKPPLVRNYNILLKTAEPQTRVICDFYPPDNFKAVYTINAGSVLVGTLPDTRVPIAKIGDNVVIEGKCKGLSSGGVKLTNCELNGR